METKVRILGTFGRAILTRKGLNEGSGVVGKVNILIWVMVIHAQLCANSLST